MKFSMLTIAGAIASANAAIRGDSTKALKKMALMQKMADAANKKAFGVIRRLEAEGEEDQNVNYEYGEVTAETIIQPYMCVTANVYGYQAAEEEGGEEEDENNNANSYSSSSSWGKPTVSYLSFVGVNDDDNNGYNYLYGDSDEYMTTLPEYLRAIGTAWAEERAQLCDDCEMMENFCTMSEEERYWFASMTEDEFTAYLEEVEQGYEEENNRAQQQAQQQQNQNNEAMEEEENNAYAAYSAGDGQGNVNGGYQNNGNYDNYGGRRRHLFESIQTLCGTCQQKCVDEDDAEQSQEYYEEMEALFEESMCTAAGDGMHYIGHTCGGNGKSIELAMFYDANCMYLAGETNAYELYQTAVAQSYGNGDADGDGQQDYNWSADDLAYGYMTLVTEMFEDEYSCAMGAVRSYNGADPSEACENLYAASISKTNCLNGGNWNNANEEGEEEEENNQNKYYNAGGTPPEGYDMYYSQNMGDVCSTILELEASLAKKGRNPFNGSTFGQLYGKKSGGAIAGIVIAVIAAVGAAAYVYQKKTAKKTDLEEPVFQGGALS